MSKRVAMDIGGTFTDVVVYEDETGAYSASKVVTTPADFAEGVLNGLDLAVGALEDVAFCVHGTTVGLNALLERRGERVLLLTNQGMRDIYHIARGSRHQMYDLHFRKPKPLVPLEDIREVRGRIDYAGRELEPLGVDDLEAAVGWVRSEKIPSIAVAFLFSYINPEHELQAERVLGELLPGVSISLSHRIANEWREYERTSSVVLNAYIAPRVEQYLGRLEVDVRSKGMSVPLHVMQSSGGVLTAESARRRPLYTLLSGPVGGTVGGVALSEILGRPNLLCIDMGGTSFDVSLVMAGRPDVSSETTQEGFPILMPVVNIHTVGAGGGSIAYLEAGGLRVGPESAGANPGPACYGRGGVRPTVTDANLVLGRLDPDYFLGGRMNLDVGAAEAAVGELAREIALEPLHLAEGIIDVVNAKMAQAIRTITVEKGIEARDFALVAFGGAGPLHAAFLAEELEIREVIVPLNPGAFSAWGMLQTQIRHDISRSFYRTVDAARTRPDLAKLIEELSHEGKQALAGEAIDPSRAELRFFADIRYVGQEYTVAIQLDPQVWLDPGFADKVTGQFHRAHETRYGHANPDAAVEIVAIRLAALGDLGRAAPQAAPQKRTGEVSVGPHTFRQAVFDRKQQRAAVFLRERLPFYAEINGPAIVDEPTATTVVPPGWRLRVDEYGSLVLRLRAEGED